MPAQVEIYAEGAGDTQSTYKLLFIAKGGGSANKSFLFQATPAILTHDRMLAFLKEKVLDARHRGLPALSPRHRDRRHFRGADDENREACLDQVLRQLAEAGSPDGHAFRDLAMEQEAIA